MNNLQIFVKGGIGNQLIQLAYSHNLRPKNEGEIIVNKFYFSRLYSKLSRNTSRHFRHSLLPDYIKVMNNSIWSFFCFLHFKVLRFIGSRNIIDDTFNLSDRSLVSTIGTIYLDGYFQGEDAFNGNTNAFWAEVAKNLQLMTDNNLDLLQRYKNSMIIHIRHGDYLRPENMKLFSIQDVNYQIRKALDIRNRLELKIPINILADPSTNLNELISAENINFVNILPALSELEDLLVIASHRYIIASNSTYCLCAAKLSEYVTGNSHHMILPDRWFVDKVRSDDLFLSLSNCTFVNRCL